MDITYKTVETEGEFEGSRRLRYTVFITEMGLPADEELDCKDDESVHVIALHGGRIVGTGRATVKGHTAKLSRVAVEQSYRRKGIGREIVERLVDSVKRQEVAEIELSSAFQSVPFYEKLGFIVVGDPFVECGSEVKKKMKKI